LCKETISTYFAAKLSINYSNLFRPCQLNRTSRRHGVLRCEFDSVSRLLSYSYVTFIQSELSNLSSILVGNAWCVLRISSYLVKFFVYNNNVSERRRGFSRDGVLDVVSTPLEGSIRVRQLFENNIHDATTNGALDFFKPKYFFAVEFIRRARRLDFVR